MNPAYIIFALYLGGLNTPNSLRTTTNSRRMCVSYNGGITGGGALGHLLDENTVALWRLDMVGEGPDGTSPDETGVYTLFNTGPDQESVSFSDAGQINGMVYHSVFPTNGAVPLSSDAGQPFAELSGDLTIEFWMKKGSSDYYTGDTIVSFTNADGSEHIFSIGTNSSDHFIYKYKSGPSTTTMVDSTAGTNTIWKGYGVPWATRKDNPSWTHVAARRRLAIDGHWYVDFFTDGIWRSTVKRVTNRSEEHTSELQSQSNLV